MKHIGRIYGKLVALCLAAGALLRVLLAFNGQTVDSRFTWAEWLQILFLGVLNDWCILTLGCGAGLLFLLTLGNGKYRPAVGYTLLGLLTAAWLYVTFCHTVFDEYGSALPLIASLLTGYCAAGFALRLFIPKLRKGWTLAWSAILLVCYVGGILFNTVSEWFFWNEFGVRYNFIAVDYLVYTNEVVGNIMESYPILPLASVLLLATAAVSFLLFRRELRGIEELKSAKGWRLPVAGIWVAAAGLSLWMLPFNTRFQQSDNTYLNELQASGPYKFYDAFRKNELDYRQFYLTLPDDEVRRELARLHGPETPAAEAAPGERHPNIVLITIESMSARFMAHFGNTEGLTPHLDSLCDRSLAFTRLFATGNRTVRGLEALTLSLPPSPGQSLIKRDIDPQKLFTTGELLRGKGYATTFYYGGNSYFDNMEHFFGSNGYEIVDQKCYAPEEITFANIWGVCDEDAYRKALRDFDAKAAAGTPFFAHLMTVSNHRPYTYPEGRIPIAPEMAKTRQGAVMYSDYAIGRFLAEAEKRPWFANTVFVIVADHCASSAGKTEIPLERYHIPALIYSPALIEPRMVDKVASQIDLMPTLFALLGMAPGEHFYGRNILAEDFRERALIATYQDLGYVESDTLTRLYPVKRCEQYRVRKVDTPERYRMEPLPEGADSTLLKRAITLYQSSIIE